MIGSILAQIANGIAASAVYGGIRDLIVQRKSALDSAVYRTSKQFSEVEGIETALRQWTSSEAFILILERYADGERDFDNEIVRSFIDDGGFYIPDDDEQISLAKEILAHFEGVFAAELYQSEGGVAYLANRVEELHLDLAKLINDHAAGAEAGGSSRESSGSDGSPGERVVRYLLKPDSWGFTNNDNFGGGYFHHKTYPEFTLKVDASDNTVVPCDEEWTRGEIRRDNNFGWFRLVFYHQTLLHRTLTVSFDDGKKSMVAPDWCPRGKGRFYFYKSDSVDYALQRFDSILRRKDDSTALRIRGDGKACDDARALFPGGMKIPVVDNDELAGFLGDEEILDPNTDESEQYHLFLRNQLDFEEWPKKQAMF